MKLSRSRYLALLVFPAPLISCFVLESIDLWSLSVWFGLLFVYVPKKISHRRYPQLSLWTCISSWCIAFVGITGGILGLILGAFINRQAVGLCYGVALGLIMGISMTGLIWIFYYLSASYLQFLKSPSRFQYASKYYLTSIYSMGLISSSFFQIFNLQHCTSLSIQDIIATTLIRGVGLSLVMLWGYLQAGLTGLAIFAVWIGFVYRIR